MVINGLFNVSHRKYIEPKEFFPLDKLDPHYLPLMNCGLTAAIGLDKASSRMFSVFFEVNLVFSCRVVKSKKVIPF